MISVFRSISAKHTEAIELKYEALRKHTINLENQRDEIVNKYN